MTLDREPEGNSAAPESDNGAACAEAMAKEPPPLEQWVAKRVRMTLNQFSSFATVAKYLSVSKASAELRVSQPSISLQLKQLEDHHGRKLYRRTNKGVEITDAGQVFLRKISPILEQVAELERGFQLPATKTLRAALSVGGTFSSSAVLLPKLMARFRRLHPELDLELQTGTTAKLERLVARGAMQIAVTDREPVAHWLESEPLRAEKVLAFVRPDHPLAQLESVSLSEFLSEPLIVRSGKGISGATQNALKKLKEQGWTVRIGMLCDGPGVIKAGVRQNMGIGIAFADSVKLELEAGEFKVLQVRDFEIHAESFVIYAKNRPLPAPARDFLELLRDVPRKGISANRSRRPTTSARPSPVGNAMAPLAAAALE
jgi:DNA-binding transcriptional LysR family regulator